MLEYRNDSPLYDKGAMGMSRESSRIAKSTVVEGWEKVYICNCGLSRLPFYPPSVCLEHKKAVHTSAMFGPFGDACSFSVLRRRRPSLHGKCLAQKRELAQLGASRRCKRPKLWGPRGNGCMTLSFTPRTARQGGGVCAMLFFDSFGSSLSKPTILQLPAQHFWATRTLGVLDTRPTSMLLWCVQR